jgi:hypothetical protein
MGALQHEIAWRASEIAKLEAEIVALDAVHWEARGRLERVRHRQAALEAGAHDLPLEADPRLAGARAERAVAEAELAAARAALEALSVAPPPA